MKNLEKKITIKRNYKMNKRIKMNKDLQERLKNQRSHLGIKKETKKEM